VEGHPDCEELGTMRFVEFPDEEQNLTLCNELFED